jgi:hypothetical protein
VILRTTDGGITWDPQSIPTQNDLYAVSCADANHGWAVGWYGTIINTSDENTGWMVGWYGTILHTTSEGFVAIGGRRKDLTPGGYALLQNYPNPFNPSTTIEFTLPKSEFAELKVFNILGEAVSTLVSKNLNQGNHTYTFDGKNLASGVYYYQLVTGDYREVKKMIFLR